MGLTCSSSASETSCSTIFATFKNDNCMSSCMKAEDAAAIQIGSMIEVLAKKYVEDHFQIIITDRIPKLFADHMVAMANAAVEAIPPANVLIPALEIALNAPLYDMALSPTGANSVAASPSPNLSPDPLTQTRKLRSAILYGPSIV
jgi:hypothetical protein